MQNTNGWLCLERLKKCICSASTAVPLRIYLELKGIAGLTPPVPSGSEAAQICWNSVVVVHTRLRTVLCLPGELCEIALNIRNGVVAAGFSLRRRGLIYSDYHDLSCFMVGRA